MMNMIPTRNVNKTGDANSRIRGKNQHYFGSMWVILCMKRISKRFDRNSLFPFLVEADLLIFEILLMKNVLKLSDAV